MNKQDKVYVAGHQGLVGSAIVRLLEKEGYSNIITRTHAELDLTNQGAVREFFSKEKPDYVFLAAAKVGGIHANNTYPAEFIYDNLMIQSNAIDAAYQNQVKRLLFLGSSCIYPKLATQPMQESALLTGPLEPTNEPYAIAKIVGIKMCESYNRQYSTDFRSVMPTNLYGPGDNYHGENSHVIPALIKKFHEAKMVDSKSVTVWGTGEAMREFLYVDDMANACHFIMNIEEKIYRSTTQAMLSHINIGVGADISIRELSEAIKDVVGYKGTINFDSSKPDGAPRKLLDCSLLKSMGWVANTDIKSGLMKTYNDYVNSLSHEIN